MFRNREGKIRSGWKIVFAVTALYLALLSIAALYNMASGAVMQRNIPAERAEEIIKILELLSSYLQDIVMIVIAVVAWKRLMHMPLSKMGLVSVKVHSGKLLTGLILGAASMSIVFILYILTGSAETIFRMPYFSVELALGLLFYLLLHILVGAAEEIFVRGFLMSVLRESNSTAVSAVISAVIFALLHSGNSGIGMLPYINITLAGILFSYMYIKSGNLWMSIGYHITWNYFQGNIFGFLVSGQYTRGIITTKIRGNDILNGGAFGPEGGLIVTAVFLAGFLFVRFLFPVNKQIINEPGKYQ